MKRADPSGDWKLVCLFSRLKAVKSAGLKDADRVMETMRALPVNDPVTKNAKLRIDRKVERDQYLLQAKSPEDSKGEWDLLKIS